MKESPKKKNPQSKSPDPKKIESNLEAKLLRYLSYKPRSVQEMVDAGHKYLSRYDLDPKAKKALINKKIEELKKLNYLDDIDYARSYIQEQIRRPTPRGPFYIFRFLITKGISREIIQKLLDELFPPEIQEKCIRRIQEKKEGEDPKRLIAYLLRRGFDKRLVYSLVDRNSKKT